MSHNWFHFYWRWYNGDLVFSHLCPCTNSKPRTLSGISDLLDRFNVRLLVSLYNAMLINRDSTVIQPVLSNLSNLFERSVCILSGIYQLESSMCVGGLSHQKPTYWKPISSILLPSRITCYTLCRFQFQASPSSSFTAPSFLLHHEIRYHVCVSRGDRLRRLNGD